MLKMFQRDFFLQLESSIIIALLQSHHQVPLVIYIKLFILPSFEKKILICQTSDPVLVLLRTSFMLNLFFSSSSGGNWS